MMMARGTRLTIDLGNEDFLKEVKIAAVQEGKSIRTEGMRRLTGTGKSCFGARLSQLALAQG
jgi:hypothetical protein